MSSRQSNRFVRLRNGFLFVAAFICGFSSIPLTAQAYDEVFWSNSDILFYDPRDGSCSAGGNGLTVGGSSLPAETTAYLDRRNVKELAEQNKERYEYAEKQTGVPWQVMAALHYREAGMDPGKSISNGAPLGSGVNVDGVNVVSDANQDAANMGEHFKRMARYVYDIEITVNLSTMTTQDWGNSFLAYNRGFLYKQASRTYDQSPYVMNGFDANHINMSWIDADTVSGVDGNKAGALAVLTYLGGASGGAFCSATSGVVAGSIVETALGLAQPYVVPNGTTRPEDATPQYREAIVTYNKSVAQYPQITDCGRFVSTVMRGSGADPEYPDVYVPTMISYMNSSSKYTFVGNVGIGSMQPGDIVATPGHIIIYTGENNGHVAADASFHGRIPALRTSAGVQWMVNENAGVWRIQ